MRRMMRLRARRLSVVDEMFLRTHRGFGTPVVMQGLWRGGPVSAPDLQRVHDALAGGPLSATVVRPRIPGARPRLRPGGNARPLEWTATAIPRDGVVGWADSVANRSVDPVSGPGWSMAATRTEDGGTVVSLVCSHVLTDARGLASVLADAMTGVAHPPPPDPDHPLLDDLVDAVRMVAVVGGRTVRAVAGLVRHPSRLAELRAEPVPVVTHAHAPAPETLIVDVDARDWDAAAVRAGGTPNSLLVALAAHIASGHAPLQVSVPVDRRTGTSGRDGTSNSIDMVAVTIPDGAAPREVRALLREAYGRPPMSGPAGFPPELLQLVPDAVAYRLAPDPGELDILCSNIGPVPGALGELGGVAADAVATRAVHPGIDDHRLATSRTRLSAYLSRLGDRYTLALVSKDTGLAGRTTAALRTFGLAATNWDDPT